MSELLLLRHCKPELAGSYIGRGSDPPLDAEGARDAESIADRLCAEKLSFIYSSPLKRARQSVEALSRRLGIPIQIEEDLAEIHFGDWEGRTWKEIEDADPDYWRLWVDEPWVVAPPGGESLEQLNRRVGACITRILDRHDSEKILVASHGGPIRVVLGQAFSLEPAFFWSARIDYAGLCRFGRLKHGPLELLQWNLPLDKNDPGT